MTLSMPTRSNKKRKGEAEGGRDEESVYPNDQKEKTRRNNIKEITDF